MANDRDFFGFCTSLKPLELKALGELSEIRHIAAGEVIYSVGDGADALYIISRGMVEMVQENSTSVTRATYLSRGDIFGAVEMLSDLPRRKLVRSCDGVSLRVFPREHLNDLLARVPSFFRYVCERLAIRLLQAGESAVALSHCRELSGSLAQFDLVTIYQTITQSSQTGELSIHDDAGKLLAAFQFDSGHPRGGTFQHLAGEQAFLQLFIAHDLRGTFSFDSGAAIERAPSDKTVMQLRPDELLIRSLQARDELEELKRELPEHRAAFRHAAPALNAKEIAPELRPTAEKIWRLSLARAVALDAFYRQCAVCELTIYRTVHELLRTGHLELTPSVGAKRVA